MKKRMIVSLIAGALLGVFCIIGANLRFNGTLETSYLFAFWFNRLLMGFVIGLIAFKLDYKWMLVRGLVVGLIVSFAFYSATDFLDLTGFLVGGVYGIIIEIAAFHLTRTKTLSKAD